MIAYLPVKPNSVRLPGKNFRLLGNKPLYRWALDTVATLRDKLEDDVIVWSSRKVDVPSGARWVYRDPVFEHDKCDPLEMYREAARTFPSESYLRLNATSPFIRRSTYEKVIDAGAEYESVVTAVATRRLMWGCGAPLNHSGNWPVAPGEKIPPVFVHSGGATVVSHRMLFEDGCLFGSDVHFVTVSAMEAIDIDYQHEFDLAQLIARLGAL